MMILLVQLKRRQYDLCLGSRKDAKLQRRKVVFGLDTRQRRA